jgi:anaerobic magnesium-protoporphyrin IX monomethyl ester cyclase
MKILLTHGYFLADDAKEQKIMRPYPPLGLLYIAAFLDEHGYFTDVFDTTFSDKQSLQNHLLIAQPDVVGLYTNLMTKINVIEVMAFIRKNLPATKIIVGGPDARYNAGNYLHEGAHIIAYGEGEQTMLELIRHLPKNKAELHQVAGIAFFDGSEFKQTQEREKIKQLDELPLPARHKINLHLYLDAWKKFHGKNAISVSTMRGCPYTCKWCSRGVYGLSYRRRSAEKVVQEIQFIKQTYNPDSLWFVDDVFTISHKWMMQFRDELIKSNIYIPYECITRADRLNDEVIQILKETGCFRVWIGAESGSQKVIDLMDRRVDVAQVREMIRLARKNNIEAGTFIMLGYPGETEEDIRQTMEHLRESDPDHFTITIAYPIKGTELYQEIEPNYLPAWNNSTDRDIDFKRTYSRRYYDYAVKWVVNEVNFEKLRQQGIVVKAGKIKLKSVAARVGMWFEKRRSPQLSKRIKNN